MHRTQPNAPRRAPHTAHCLKRSLCLIALCACSTGILTAGDSKLETNNPFLPAGYNTAKPAAPKPPPVQQANGPIARELEFRGVVLMNGKYQFSLFNKSENKGYWIPENGSENGIGASNFNLERMTILVNYRGRSEQLELITPSGAPLPVTTSIATNTPKVNIPGITPPTGEPVKRRRRVIPRRRVILPKKQ